MQRELKMLYIPVDNEYQFIEAFENSARAGQYTVPALEALYQYYSDITDGAMEELDVIALCCTWTEYTECALVDTFQHLAPAPPRPVISRNF